MKLLRYGPVGAEKPGILDADGRMRDLSAHVASLDAEALSPRGLQRLRAIDPASLPLVDGEPRLGVPFTGIGKFVAVGLNYSDHAAESGMPSPKEPILFMKATSCLCGPNDDTVQPRDSTKLDWEVELGIVIGTRAQYVPEERALEHVAGYCVVNDVSERDFQLERGSQWDRGKGCDTFGPVGPWLVTTDEVPDPQALDMWLDVNGEPRQRGSTRTMIFGCATLVSYISRFMTLLPGDIITTGTPPGVAMGMKPPRWLVPGDVVTLGIGGLGQQRQRVVAWNG
ncbi:fumarylacetoacetate hydrolase family protein [Piscinibacter koreensis]|uniref:Fumarylacetoacetate hydrolase family protein n=1 Tax=Piscinibacter koreensis TaxID=2742824 RepID=A0A7Y6NS69_9BURK|nr:fumarylacetoacetate hydrolase family protein [Schlegelella koreensis]NUZ08369.1 fumarylacetoacetate hydrolase family protein [Schlegelella koreensis]